MTFVNKLTSGLVSRSIKHAFKESKNRFKELLKLACFWRLLCVDSAHIASNNIKQRVLISEIPIPGSVCIPHNLTSMITLKDRTLDDVLMGFERRERKFFNIAASGFTLKQITDIKQVARLNQEMLMPYAADRYGKAVYQLPFKQVTEMAIKSGRLHW